MTLLTFFFGGEKGASAGFFKQHTLCQKKRREETLPTNKDSLRSNIKKIVCFGTQLARQRSGGNLTEHFKMWLN